MFFLPGTHKDHGLTYSPLKALISPRPIGWISSLSASGVANLSPYSFFNAIAELPPMVMFISAPDMREANRGGQKDSLANILETREFGVNIVGSEQAEQMVKSSQDVTADIDEFDHTSLGKKKAEKISAPLVAGAPAHLECVYYNHITLPDNGRGNHSVMVMGTIVGIHIDEAIIADGRVDVSRYTPVARLGYKDYTAVRDLFEMTP
ncbi:MAG: flavin reductase family protein [Candidatus Puniceispirillaceae bacterium]|nr:flavin reductase [Alphaproteobacteria bacterium]|tara:strand:+ start:2263 stop:2883 length:621 start_codon:yes stop_codon:yes gene_type:complete